MRDSRVTTGYQLHAGVHHGVQVGASDRPGQSSGGVPGEVVDGGAHEDSTVGDVTDDAVVEVEAVVGHPGAVLDTVDSGGDRLLDPCRAVRVCGDGKATV